MSDNGWCVMHDEWVNEGSTCYVCGVVKAERDRIIALLEEHKKRARHTDARPLETAIALIKGENE